MAFTKAPVNDTHNIVRLPASGEAFTVSNHLLDSEPLSANYINCFPLSEQQFHQDKRYTIQKRHSWKGANAASGTVTTTAGMGACLVMAPDVSSYPNVFFAKYVNYYMFNYSTKVVSSVTTSTGAGLAQLAAGTVAVDSTNVKRICFLDSNDELKTFLQDGTSVTTTTTGRGLDGRKGLVYLNGYLYGVDSTGYKIHNSNAAGVLTTWSSTDYISAEQFADPVVWIDKHKNHLVAFGTSSIEFFYDAGIEIGSPLARQESYCVQVGLYTANVKPGKTVCHIDDDIYFLGTKDNDSVGLYRIRNFKVEEVDSQYMQTIFNYTNADPKTDITAGLETMIINNHPMVVINTKSISYVVVYFPKEDTWWQMTNGVPPTADFGDAIYRLGTMFFSQNRGFGMFLGQESTTGSVLLYYVPDQDHTQSVTAQITTPVLDLGINYYKHIARVDAIGDFGQNNTLTLKYRPSAVYETDLVTCSPNRTPGNNDYNASWYNLGAFRRFSMELTIAGYDHAVFEGFDIEYNVGAL
jgi:hypothetical protein